MTSKYLDYVLWVVTEGEELMRFINADQTHPYIVYRCRTKDNEMLGFMLVNTDDPQIDNQVIHGLENVVEKLGKLVDVHRGYTE